MRIRHALALTAASAALWSTTALAQAIVPEKGMEANMVLLPKFLGILPFDQAHPGGPGSACRAG